MKIVIASTRVPKVNGVRRAYLRLSALYPLGPMTFEPIVFESGVESTPLSVDALMTGARQRALRAFQNARGRNDGSEKIHAVGAEGGLCIFQGRTFLQSWVYVHDGSRTSFGSSGSIELPAALADAVVRDGADVGSVIDLFAEERNVRLKQGTWGILTNDLITREDSFELAALNALAPFFNNSLYDRSLPGRG